MDVSIIIVNYNTKELLANCINSIYKNTSNVNFEIVIVDNASTDGSQEFIKKNFSDVLLIESDENLGFGKANNLGAKSASGDFLFLLNSDTILLNNAIFLFLDFYNKNKFLNIGCLGGLLVDQNGNSIHSSESFPLKRRIFFDIINNYFRGLFRSPFKRETLEFENKCYFEVDYITGADLFISKELFFKVEGFDPRFFMYYEETDLQKKVSRLGLKRFIIKEPKIIHLEGASVSEALFSAKKRIMINDGMFKYFKKNSSFISYYIFRLFFLIIRLPILFDRRITYKERRQYIHSLMRKN